MTKTVTSRPSFQGDLMIRRITAIPPGVKKTAPLDGVHIVAHSESGHNHVVESRAADRFIDETNAFIAYLDVTSPADIEHLRSFDTHEALHLEPGIYEVRNQREYTPEGWRPAAD